MNTKNLIMNAGDMDIGTNSAYHFMAVPSHKHYLITVGFNG